jgi:hypothetical protein
MLDTKKGLKGLIKQGAIPILESNDFERNLFTFYRQRGSTIQIVDFQPSVQSGLDRVCYVNIGLAFDILFHDEPPKAEIMHEEDCHFRSRLEYLCENCPKWWVIPFLKHTTRFFREISTTNGREIVERKEDIPQVAAYLGGFIQKAVQELNTIDDPKSFVTHPWAHAPGNDGLIEKLSQPR